MIQLMLIIFIAGLLSVALKIRSDDVLPVVVLSSFLIMYVLGLFIPLNYSIYIVLATEILFAVILFCLKKGFENIRKNIKTFVLTEPLIICLIVCIITCFAFSTHKVIHWDDLSYWGIYSKNLFYINHLPSGAENCSVMYKDYTPFMQIAEYFFMYGMKSFAEPLLFIINACFMYIMLLPVLHDISGKGVPFKIGSVLLYVIFPHVFTTQFYYKLGVDYLLSVVFGYCLFSIIDECQNKAFYYLRIIVIMSSLTMIKSSGIVLSLLAVPIYYMTWVSKVTP